MAGWEESECILETGTSLPVVCSRYQCPYAPVASSVCTGIWLMRLCILPILIVLLLAPENKILIPSSPQSLFDFFK